MRGSGAGIYVLRLVLQRQQLSAARGFSTAVIDREKDKATTDSAWTGSSLFPGLKALASRSVNEEHQQSIDFLEDEGAEYEAIRGVLPARSTERRPIPWPTIFAHPEQEASTSSAGAGSSSTTRTRICDPVARLVGEKELVAARKVHDELRAARIRVVHRAVYMEAASQSLDARDTNGFLFWLRLYPNRPATKNHPGLRATLEPITNAVLSAYPFDLEFIAQYAATCAKKGVLPAVIHDLIRHLTYIAAPEVSGPIIDEALSTYVAHTTSAKSTSDRAQAHLHVAERQVAAWKEAYNRAVVAHGWYASQEAREQGDWQDGQRLTPRTIIPEGMVKLRDRMAFAIDTPPAAMDLVGIIRDLRDRWPAEEEVAFRESFIRPPGKPARQIHPSPETREYEWWRAIMMVEGHYSAGNHQAVIDTFQDHYRWFGLPDHPARRKSGSSDDGRKLLHPRRSVMTALLPSLLAGMTSYDIISFHKAYLEQSHGFPPVLKPDAHIHNIFIRAIAHHGSTDAAMAAIKSIVAHGYDCGSQAMTTVLYSLARSGHFDDMFALLSGMEQREPFHFDLDSDSPAPGGRSTITLMPPPMEVTYAWLANIIRKKSRHHAVAEEVVRRGQAFFGGAREDSGHEELEKSTG